MKRFLLHVGFLAAFILSGTIASGQMVSDRKMEKDAKKMAKQLVKEGWKVAPGHPTIEMQQLKASKINNTMDENFNSKFVMGSAQALGASYDVAKYQATELAKINIAGLITSELAGIAKTRLGNKQLQAGQAASIAETIGAYNNYVAAKLVNIISCIDMYKVDPKTGNTIVSIGIFYDKDEAMRAGIEEAREQIRKESEELAKELDDLFSL